MKKSEKILAEHPVNKKRVQEGKNPATSIWIWGEGKKPILDKFEEKFGKKASVISAVDLIKGIAICAGMDSIDVPGATGTYHTNFDGKAKAAIKAVTEDGSDMVYVHMEAPDECGHQGDWKNKKLSVELIDEKVVKYIKEVMEEKGEDYKMLILPDHPTPIVKKTHVSDPVPYIIYDSTKNEGLGLVYNEKNAEKTGVYIDLGYELMGKFLK